ncbi:MAG TPA: DUF1223 domain-containing protein [Burkholderiaceae bacterium]|nr:DUF1223 domain-containing protein [Burkholderiaceae bacterium]
MSTNLAALSNTLKRLVLGANAVCATAAFSMQDNCSAQSGASQVPVIELYTSEGCSSCPPADRWLSGLKGQAAQGRVVAQAFHVGYWDYIGWIDRFAAPAHTARQKQIAAANNQRGIYTPQLVRNGQDWRDYGRALAPGTDPSRASINLQRVAGDAFDATVTPAAGVGVWSAYWTVTEHGHSSKVKSGENAGEYLQHDFVVRQYVPAGTYSGPSRLTLRAVAADAAHPRQVNLVVFEPKTGRPLQALSLGC